MRAGKEPVVPTEFGEPPQWIIGYHNQIPTILSLLTPEYQQRLVQQLFHQAHDRAAQWSAMLCRPEGFMRWWSGPGGPGSLDVTVTPTRVQFLGGSGNAIRNVHVGRTFDLSGAVPRLGADVPRWMGETVGFWDGNALITWTSNIQGGSPIPAGSIPTSCKRSRSLRRVWIRRVSFSGWSTRLSSTTRTRCYNRSATFDSCRDRALQRRASE